MGNLAQMSTFERPQKYEAVVNNREKFVFPSLEQMTELFNKQFDKVSLAEPSFSMRLEYFIPDNRYNEEIFDATTTVVEYYHYVVEGVGTTAEEAVADWFIKACALSFGQGNHIYWRTPVEISRFGKTYRVYGRFTVAKD